MRPTGVESATFGLKDHDFLSDDERSGTEAGIATAPLDPSGLKSPLRGMKGVENSLFLTSGDPR